MLLLILTLKCNFRISFPNSNSFQFLDSHHSTLSEPLSPECRLEGSHLLRGCQQWAHSLWPCGTEPCSFSLPMIKTHSPHLVKELQILSFVLLSSRTSHLTPSSSNSRGLEKFKLVKYRQGSVSILPNFLFLQFRGKQGKINLSYFSFKVKTFVLINP